MDLYKFGRGVGASQSLARDSSEPMPQLSELSCHVSAQPQVAKGEVSTEDMCRELERRKQQLRELASLSRDNYKKGVRRLYLECHPDKAGPTVFNNMIFRMIREHLKWYECGCDGSDPLEKYGWDGIDEQAGMAMATESAEATPREEFSHGAYRSRPSGQATWFEEFEEERRRRRAHDSAHSSGLSGVAPSLHLLPSTSLRGGSQNGPHPGGSIPMHP